MANIRGPKNEQDGESLDGLNEGLLGTRVEPFEVAPGRRLQPLSHTLLEILGTTP
jgi:hypothetical protein